MAGTADPRSSPLLSTALLPIPSRRYARQAQLTTQLSSALEARHESFHPLWGQLFKAGHQNSRWAQQVQDYACLYTSHATNLMCATWSTLRDARNTAAGARPAASGTRTSPAGVPFLLMSYPNMPRCSVRRCTVPVSRRVA